MFIKVGWMTKLFNLARRDRRTRLFLMRMQHINMVKLLEHNNSTFLNRFFFFCFLTLISRTCSAARLGNKNQSLPFLHDSNFQLVIYRDVKASNILLDSEFNAKLSDFGVAKAGPTGDRTHVSTQVMGAEGYAAP
ncbi:unnamed protein product, partial [Musa textilis]